MYRTYSDNWPNKTLFFTTVLNMGFLVTGTESSACCCLMAMNFKWLTITSEERFEWLLKLQSTVTAESDLIFTDHLRVTLLSLLWLHLKRWCERELLQKLVWGWGSHASNRFQLTKWMLSGITNIWIGNSDLMLLFPLFCIICLLQL